MKRRAGIGAGALVLIASCLLAWNEARNAAARAELEDACACARRSVESTLLQSGPILGRLFEEDEEMVRGFLRGEVVGSCTEVRAALAPFAWNVGRSFSPRGDPSTANRIRAAVERARPRCPAIYAELLGGIGVHEARAAALCAELLAGMELSGQPVEPVSVWAWPAGIRSSMCLVASNSPRAASDDRP